MRKRTVIGTIVAVAATTIAAYICHQVRQLEPRGFKSISVAFNKMLVLHRNHDVTVLEFTSYDDRGSQRFLNFGIQKAGPLSFRWRQRQHSGQERQGKGSVSETALVKYSSHLATELLQFNRTRIDVPESPLFWSYGSGTNAWVYYDPKGTTAELRDGTEFESCEMK